MIKYINLLFLHPWQNILHRSFWSSSFSLPASCLEHPSVQRYHNNTRSNDLPCRLHYCVSRGLTEPTRVNVTLHSATYHSVLASSTPCHTVPAASFRSYHPLEHFGSGRRALPVLSPRLLLLSHQQQGRPIGQALVGIRMHIQTHSPQSPMYPWWQQSRLVGTRRVPISWSMCF